MRSKVNLIRYALTISTVLCSFIATPQVWSQVTELRMMEALEREQAKAEKFDAALEKKIALDLKEQPLTKLAEELSTQMGVDVELDVAGMELAGVSENDQITAKLQNVSARSGLKRVLAQLDLTYIIKDEAFVITSAETCGHELVERIYDVSHLIQESVATDNNTVRLGNGRRLRAEELAEHLQETVAPEAWEENGGTSTISVYIFTETRVFLVVSTQPGVHDSVTISLGRLTSMLDRTSTNDSASVSQANKTNKAKQEETKKPDLIKEDQIVTFVYPIKQYMMKSEEAVELIETVLGKEVLQMEKGSFLIKKIGNTVVIKHYKKVQDQVYKLLEDADVLQEEGEPVRPTHRGCYSLVPVVG